MTDEPRRARRDPGRTRRLLLDAAARAVSSHGAGVSVETIARAAGVSKSGLLHHFASKDDLFVALADDAYERFRLEVEARTDPADLAPGRVMRGYVRASFAGLRDGASSAGYWAVEAQLSVVPAVASAIRSSTERWESRLTADGLDREVMRLVLLATTGAEVGASVGAVGQAELGALEEQLLRLTASSAVLGAILAPQSEVASDR